MWSVQGRFKQSKGLELQTAKLSQSRLSLRSVLTKKTRDAEHLPARRLSMQIPLLPTPHTTPSTHHLVAYRSFKPDEQGDEVATRWIQQKARWRRAVKRALRREPSSTSHSKAKTPRGQDQEIDVEAVAGSNKDREGRAVDR